MSEADLIRRIDAMQACQVGPSDEWAKATKSGYNQAATDCAINIMRIEPIAPTTAQLMADERVKSLVEAGERMRAYFTKCNSGDVYAGSDFEAALAKLKEPKP